MGCTAVRDLDKCRLKSAAMGSNLQFDLYGKYFVSVLQKQVLSASEKDIIVPLKV